MAIAGCHLRADPDRPTRRGDRLPSTTELKAEYDVSYGSIRGAMLVLKTGDLVEGRQGEGVYVKAVPAD
ncbi:hypothetical protein B5D80_28600 [Micromonospora wenchangensis]|uniref:HTH gntR-type domain-containing protein n=1 Tax=Micromonospora wenchangensis TaxID=1185415 RepID=A0A246RFH7_9ACTN|nr:hypothetical protein B5D80_28600 [Micromonospora wenchangensis]